jgi:hypothetical protein
VLSNGSPQNIFRGQFIRPGSASAPEGRYWLGWQWEDRAELSEGEPHDPISALDNGIKGTR